MELDAIVVGPHGMIFLLPENIVVYGLGFTFVRGVGGGSGEGGARRRDRAEEVILHCT